MTSMVFSLPGHENLGARLSTGLQAPEGVLTMREFPDGETYVRGETRCEGGIAVVAANLLHPNAQVLPLLFAARATRVLGASRVILVTPYLPYMRQDARFHPGEVITSRLFANLLNGAIDGLVTVDPHLHRFTTLDEIYTIPTRVEHAAPAVAGWISSSVDRPLIVGPDRESEQWVRDVAEMAGAPYVVLSKTRHGDREVEIAVPELAPWRTHTPVLVDDIISTARTMIEAIAHLQVAGYKSPVCVGVHAVLADDAFESLQRAGAADAVTCDTVPHASNRIPVTGILVDGVRCLISQM